MVLVHLGWKVRKFGSIPSVFDITGYSGRIPRDTRLQGEVRSPTEKEVIRVKLSLLIYDMDVAGIV